jgi:hypothetical protein
MYRSWSLRLGVVAGAATSSATISDTTNATKGNIGSPGTCRETFVFYLLKLKRAFSEYLFVYFLLLYVIIIIIIISYI